MLDLASCLIVSIGWRADCARQHEDTINSVRQTAQEQVPFNVQGVSTFSSLLRNQAYLIVPPVS